MFTERKITQFQQTVSELPDTPAVSASALKARFDACPEELRTALNGVCDDGKVLEERIDAYRAQTFAGEITETMLAAPLAGKINEKAAQSDMETLQNTVSDLETQLELKCGLVVGTYVGDGNATQDIELGFRPKAVLALYNGTKMWSTGDLIYGGLSIDGRDFSGITITDTGFQAHYSGDVYLNRSNYKIVYLAFR